MPSIRQVAKTLGHVKSNQAINWFPGHMYSGMQAMIGKLNTVDCVVEVHDARIPFTGRNQEFRRHLGLIKPRVLVLNKSDLADSSRWDHIKRRLAEAGDENVILSDLSGSQFSHSTRGYDKLMENVVHLVHSSERYNRQTSKEYKIMIVGIPNVGKSTLINRLRQYHLGLKGEPAATGSFAGVTRHVMNRIKVCSRPLVYLLDTPGILEPGATKNNERAMRLALCSTINDRVLKIEPLAEFLLKLLNKSKNYTYMHLFKIDSAVDNLNELILAASIHEDMRSQVKCTRTGLMVDRPHSEKICWKLVRDFRKGLLGRMTLD